MCVRPRLTVPRRPCSSPDPHTPCAPSDGASGEQPTAALVLRALAVMLGARCERGAAHHHRGRFIFSSVLSNAIGFCF